MRVFRVVTEIDGETRRDSGRLTTQIERQEYRYAAESIDQVWDAIESIRNDPEENVIAVIEEHPAVIVIPEISEEHGDENG